MEPEEIERINRHLPELIQKTMCSAPFLVTFIQRGIFSLADMKALEAEKSNTDAFGQSQKFYERIQTRVGSYAVLLEALANTTQSGVLALLKDEACEPNAKRGKTTSYIRRPKYLSDFQSGPNNTLVIHTPDCEITRNRIMETVEKVTEFTPEDYISFISVPSSKSSSIQESIPLINCQQTVNYIQYCVAHSTKKIVVVPNVFSDEIHNILARTQCEKVHHEDDVLEWDDLQPAMKVSVEETLKSFQLPVNCTEVISNLKGKALFDLIKGNKPILFKDTVPAKITYYIPRRLISRNVISKSVFQKSEKDLFLIKGMKRHELTTISNGPETDTSSNLLQKGISDKTKLVLLEYEPDYEPIVQKVGAARPVHVIEFKQDKFLWIKSSGGIGILQRAVSTSQNILTENEFFEQVVNSTTNKERDPICISDSPGMGKSILLAELARKLQEKSEHCWSVGFVIISELVEETKKFANSPDLSKHVLLSLGKIFCENELGVAYFQKCKNELTNLLLDGLDEVQSQDIDFAYKLLNLLRNILPMARIWVTTRPHMFPNLEKAFNVLGYNIKAFEEEDQVNFLKRYWIRERRESDFDLEILETYIIKCLSSLKSQINSTKEHDIAGIPLQCLLIGEVFEDDAVRFCMIKDVDIPTFCIKSITDLYELVVKKKFDRFHKRYDKEKKYEDSNLEREHIYYSVSLLFPTFRDKFVKKFPSTPIPLQTIFNVGILEYKTVLSSPQFIHRTFAEYFVAKYIVDGLYFTNLSNNQLNLLFKKLLRTKKSPQHKFATAKFHSQQFLNNVICYFINSLMGKHGGVKCKDKLNKKCSNFGLTEWKRLCEGCAYGSYGYIFYYLMGELPVFKLIEKEIFTEHFVVLCTVFSDAAILTSVYDKFKCLSGKNLTSVVSQDYSLIELAVIRGNYKVFEENIKLVEDIAPPSGETCWELLRICIDESKSQSEPIITGKIHIIRYLLSLKRIAECSSTFNMYTQELPYSSHIVLTTELIKCEELSLLQTIDFIHKATTQGDCKAYKNLLQVIPAKYASVESTMNLILNSKVKEKYLIDLIIKNMNPALDFLQDLNQLGLNFSLLSRSAFMWAVKKRNCSNETLAYLLQTFSIEECHNIFKSMMDEWYSIDALAELISYARPALAQMDTSGNTLLHLACCNTSYIGERLELIKQLIDKGADVNAQNKNKKTPLDVLLSKNATTEGLQILELLQSSCGNDHQQIFVHKINWIAQHHEELKITDNADISSAPAISLPTDSDLLSLSHIGLTTELIKCKELSVDQIINFLHKATTQGSCKEYQNLLQAIPSENENELRTMNRILNSNINGKYLIELIIRNMNPALDFLQDLNQLGLNFSLLSKSAFMRAVKKRSCSNEALEYLLQNLSANERDDIFKSIMNEWRSIDALAELISYARPAQMDTSGNTLLHLACCNTSQIKIRLELIKQLIDKGADVNAQNKDKRTPLDVLLSKDATKEGLQILELLQSSCGNDHQQIFVQKINWMAKDIEELKFADYADIRLALATSPPTDSNGNTILHIVAERGDSAMLEHLISLGADVNAMNEWKETPLHKVSMKFRSDFESWKILIDLGADPCLYDVDGNTYIHHLERCNWANIIHIITYVMNRELQLDLSSPKVEEIFLLALSVFRHTVKNLCEWFIQNVKKPLNTIQGSFRSKQATVLDAVLHNGDGDVLEYVLSTHACTETLKPFGNIWFYNVLTNRSNRSIKFLKLANELFPDLKNTPNEDGLFPLSTRGIPTDTANTLVQLGANVNAVDKSGNTPLHWALKNGHLNCESLVDLFAEHGADVNAVTANGETPLSLSLTQSSPYCMNRRFKCLIKHGADVYRTDSSGNKILHLLPSNLQSHSVHDIVSLFLKEGYKDLFHFVNTNNQTPIQLLKTRFELKTDTIALLKRYGFQVQ